MAQITRPPPRPMPIDDYMSLLGDPSAFAARLKALKDLKEECDASIALVGEASEIPRLREEVEAAQRVAAETKSAAMKALEDARAQRERIAAEARAEATKLVDDAKAQALEISTVASAVRQSAKQALVAVQVREKAADQREAALTKREGEVARLAEETQAQLADLTEKQRQLAAIFGEPK